MMKKDKILLKYRIIISSIVIVFVAISCVIFFKFNIITSFKKDIKMSDYMQVKMSMSYNQVKLILGDGVKNSLVDKYGIKTELYSWKNKAGGRISITLQGGKVVSKAETVLEETDAKVTLQDFNKIAANMTYNKVKDIVGEGQLIYESEYIANDKNDEYTWINKEGSYMTIVFIENKVIKKSQKRLK